MSALIGILVDVSGSMRNSVGDGADEEGGRWARSIFKVVDELIKHDVSSSNQTFALAFGGSSDPEVFDLLGTVGKAQDEQSSIEDLKSRSDKLSMICEVLDILRRNGASTFWPSMGVLFKVFDDTTAAEILYFLKKDSDFTQRFVNECLPRPTFGLLSQWSEDSVREVIEKGKRLVAETMKTVKIYDVSKTAIRSVHDASEILHASIKQSFILDLRSNKIKKEMIDEALTILENNGAKRVRTWGKMEVLREVLDDDTAAGILYYLQNSPEFTTKFIDECLPRECRELALDGFRNTTAEASYYLASWVPVYGSTIQGMATKESVKDVVKKGKELIAAMFDDKELTNEQFDELLKAVEPYIYGGTPLIQAMRHAVDLFSYPEFANHQKLLFILSDGQPADGNNPPLQELSDLGVTTVCCFITDQQLSDPRHLYSILDESWEKPAKFMFRVSSTITTQKIPRTLFLKREWKIDIDKNETRLFFQVNHPDIIKDVCDMAKNGVLSQDALSDILSSVDLDIYVNRENKSFGAKKQPDNEATCYAYASATVIHLAMKRIVGRDGGYPDFLKLRDKLIKKYGIYGAKTIGVLQEVCPAYRLQCKVVDDVGAMKAISEKRPVVARFGLTGAQWDQFDRFYEENPKGILTKLFLDSGSHLTSTPPHGHAVVLTSYDAESLRLMNSKSDKWADNGFFRVQNADVLGLEFVDVFWTSDDLSEEEKKAYEKHGAKVAAKLMKSLKGIKVAKYKCPLCAVESNVGDYSGHLLKAKCPTCDGSFNANKAGGDLALNLYLMSLTHKELTDTS